MNLGDSREGGKAVDEGATATHSAKKGKTKEQRQVLEHLFTKSAWPSEELKQEAAKGANLDMQQVNTWLANRRKRRKSPGGGKAEGASKRRKVDASDAENYETARQEADRVEKHLSKQMVLDALEVDDRPDGPPIGVVYEPSFPKMLSQSADEVDKPKDGLQPNQTKGSQKMAREEERERRKREKQEEKERRKQERQQERERIKQERLEQKEREKRERQQERRRKKEELKRKREEALKGPPDDKEVEERKLRQRLGIPSDQPLEREHFPMFPSTSLSPAISNDETLLWDDETFASLFSAWCFFDNFRSEVMLHDFGVEDLLDAVEKGEWCPLLGEVHMALLRVILQDLVAGEQTHALSGILEEAESRGYDTRAWLLHLNAMTWPEVMRQVGECAGLGEDGTLMPQVGMRLSPSRLQKIRSNAPPEALQNLPPRFQVGSLKAACFLTLWPVAPNGLHVSEVSQRIQKWGYRDLSSTKFPDSVVHTALARDSAFRKMGRSTYALRETCCSQGAEEKDEKAQDVEREQDDNEAEEEEEDDYTEVKKEVEQMFSPNAEDEGQQQQQHVSPASPLAPKTGELWLDRLASGEYDELSVKQRVGALEALVSLSLDVPTVRSEVDNRLRRRLTKARDLHSRLEKKGGRKARATDEDLREESRLAPELTGNIAGEVAAEMRECDRRNLIRAEPLGADRRNNRYWLSVEQDGAARVYLEEQGGRWFAVTSERELEALQSEMDAEGMRERALLRELRDRVPNDKLTPLPARTRATLSKGPGAQRKPSERPKFEPPKDEEDANNQMLRYREVEREEDSVSWLTRPKTVAEEMWERTDAASGVRRCMWCGEPVQLKKEVHLVASHETLRRPSHQLGSKARAAVSSLADAQGMPASDCRLPALPHPKLRRMKAQLMDVEGELSEESVDMAHFAAMRDDWLREVKGSDTAQGVLACLARLASMVSRKWLAHSYSPSSLLAVIHGRKNRAAYPPPCPTMSAVALALFSFDGAAKYRRGQKAKREVQPLLQAVFTNFQEGFANPKEEEEEEEEEGEEVVGEGADEEIDEDEGNEGTGSEGE